MASTVSLLHVLEITASLFIYYTSVVNTLTPNCSISFAIPGDITLGGIFSFYTEPNSPCIAQNDYVINPRGVFHAEAMRFAINEINNDASLLPNLTLGFRIEDDGWAENVSLGHTLDFLKERVCLSHDEDNDNLSSVVGIVGLSRSATTIPSTRLAELYNIAVISPLASSDELADQTQFPYFLRTVPPDGLQTAVIVDILKRYQWQYIGLIHSIDSYGIHGARQLQLQFDAEDICVAFVASVSDSASKKELQEITDKLIEFPMAKTVFMFSSGKIATKVLEQIKKNQSREIIWLGADDWGYDLQNQGFAGITKSATFTRFFSVNIPSFETYIRELDLEAPSLSPWLRTYVASRKSQCINGSSCVLFESNLSAKYITLTVIDAVNVFAHGLHALLTDKCAGEDFVVCSRRIAQKVKGDEFYGYLKKVKFEGYGGHFEFDSRLYPPGRYILRNEHSVDIGNWSLGESSSDLYINQDFKPPPSVCQLVCKPGEIIVPLEMKCCYGCQPCKDNNFKIVNDTICEECPIGMWPDVNYTQCVPIEPTDINWTHGTVRAILAASIIGLLLSVTIIITMVLHREKKIIKACSRELSAINFVGILLSFFTPFILLLPPTASLCITVEALIALCFTLTYASTLLKVNRIFRIFNATKIKVRRLKLVAPRDQVIIAGGLVAILIVIIAIGSSTSPTKPVLLVPNTSKFYAEYYCQFYYGFLITCIYNTILVLLCCYYAFKSRQVPDNYNESKFIGISVYSNLVICLCVVPVYSVTKSAVYKIAVVCLALVVNAYLHVICVYVPKIYAVKYVSEADMKVQRQSWGASTHSTSMGSTTITHPKIERPGSENTQGHTNEDASNQTHNIM
ncbi:metabotropic glutamate receptor-like [Amphiura filiformis]|uniref:metabotropic glutamate receptor-like n=1 Tax=Amphiura filiformis TaxID=82378 RepID=UPI003B223E79